MVSSYQTFQGGLSYPLLQVEATLPSGSPLKPALAAGLQKMLGRTASPSLKTSSNVTLGYDSSLGLYDAGFAISGGSIVDHFYTDAAGTKPAGTLTVAYPAGTTIASIGSTSATAPYTMAITADITSGNLPITGGGTIRLLDSTGAGEIKGNFTLTKTNVIVAADLSLSDTGNVSGTATMTEHGQTIAVTQLNGPFTDNITGKVAVSPQGYTGTATLSIPNASFRMTLTSSAGTATSVMGSYGLTISFPDGTQETIAAPLTTQPDTAPVTTGTGTGTGGGGTSTYGTPINLGSGDNPNDINNNGQIVGQAPSGAAVYWSTPSSQVLNMAQYQGHDESPFGLNNHGEVIGFGGNQAANVVWRTPTATPIALAAAGYPTGINDSGEIVGNTDTSAVVWSNATAAPITLPQLDGSVFSTAEAINASGLIVGSSSTSLTTTTSQPVYWTSASTTPNALPGGTVTEFFDKWGVNSSGQIFAATRINTPNITRYWASPTATPITLPSLANSTAANATNVGEGINTSGVIVGASTDSTGNSRAVLWKNGKITDLNTLIPANSGWTLHSALAINDSGGIVGVGSFNGADCAFYIAPK